MDVFIHSLTVTFVATIDCEDSTNHINYGSIQYTWDFGNNKNLKTSLSSVTTVYQSKGTWNFTVVASNNVSQVNYTGQVHTESGRTS